MQIESQVAYHISGLNRLKEIKLLKLICASQKIFGMHVQIYPKYKVLLNFSTNMMYW